MLVDCHVHLNNYAEQAAPHEAALENLVRRVRRHGLARAVVITSYVVNDHRPGIDEVLRLTAPHPELRVVEGVTFADGKPAGLKGMRERLERKRTVGLKLYPGYLPFYPFDPVLEPVYDLAMEFEVPVMFHAGDTYAKGAKVKYSHPLHLDEVAVDHPELQMVVCHLGNPWFRDTAEVLYKNSNVRADISGLVLESFEAKLEEWVAEEVRDIITYAGDPKDLLYGTDWPLVRMGPYLKFVESLGLDEKARERLRWRNANEVFRLGLSAPRPSAAPAAGGPA